MRIWEACTVCASAVLMLSTYGCSTEADRESPYVVVSDRTNESHESDRTNELREESQAPAEIIEASRLVLEHDFGIVGPGKDFLHRYYFKNCLKTPITIAKIKTTCGCTIARGSAPLFRPGDIGFLEVKLRSSSREVTLRKEIIVTFEESEPPTIRLAVLCTVRNPVHADTSEIFFTDVTAADCPKADFTISNYSSSNWERLTVQSKPDWLEVTFASLPASAFNEPAPLQTWLMTVVAHPHGLTLDKHNANVQIKAHAAQHCWTQIIPAKLEMQRPIVPIPARFFFGRVSEKRQSKKSIHLQFTPTSLPRDLGSIELTHNLGDALGLTLTRTSRHRCVLMATFHPDDAKGVIDGQVSVRLPHSASELLIPIYAIVGVGNE